MLCEWENYKVPEYYLKRFLLGKNKIRRPSLDFFSRADVFLFMFSAEVEAILLPSWKQLIRRLDDR